MIQYDRSTGGKCNQIPLALSSTPFSLSLSLYLFHCLSLLFKLLFRFYSKCTLNILSHLSIVSQTLLPLFSFGLKCCTHVKYILELLRRLKWKGIWKVGQNKKWRKQRCVVDIDVDSRAFVRMDARNAKYSRSIELLLAATTGQLQNEIKEHNSRESAKWKSLQLYASKSE